MKPGTPTIKWIILFAVAMTVFLYVWPGICRYTYNTSLYLRTDRLTGEIQGFMGVGVRSEVGLITYRSVQPHWHRWHGCASCVVVETEQQARARMKREEEAREKAKIEMTEDMDRFFREERDKHR